MSPFLLVGGFLVNMNKIDFLDCRDEGRATVHVGSSNFQLFGEDAEALKAVLGPATPVPAPAPAPEANEAIKANPADPASDPESNAAAAEPEPPAPPKAKPSPRKKSA